MKKILSLTLALLLIFGTLCVFPAGAAENESENKQLEITGGTLEYSELEDGNIRLDNFTGDGLTTELVLPDEIDGKTVTEIGNWAFRKCIAEKITLPNRLTKIGEYGLICEKLKSLELPETLEELGSNALSGCKKLTDLDLSSVKKIGANALYGCKRLVNVKFSDELTEIGNRAFEWCTSIKELNLPKSVKKVDCPLFDGYNIVTKINADKDSLYFTSKDGVLFNKDMTELLEYPSNKAAKSYKLPDTVTKLKTDAFLWSNNLEKLTLSKNIKTLEKNAIDICEKLTTLDFGDGMTKWTTGFFYECDKLSKIIIGKKLSKISAEKIFVVPGCDTSVKRFVVSSANKTFKSKDGVIFSKNMRRIVRYPAQNKRTAYKAPETVRIVEPYAFFYAVKLNSLSLNDKVYKIKKGAFKSTCNLDGIKIPKAVTEISDYCFQLSGINSIKIHSNIKTIGYKAFNLCVSMKKVTISEGVKTVKDEAFLYCNSFAAVRIPKSVKKIGEHAFGYRDAYSDDEDGKDVRYFIHRHSYKIKGYEGTEAERYAADNHIPFEKID